MNIFRPEELGMPPVTIRDLVAGYTVDHDTGRMRCFSNRLDPRPSYQREFVYDEKNQQEVFRTLSRGFPIGTFYWSEDTPGEYELVDGQQRTLSIMNIISDDVFLKQDDEKIYWSRLTESARQAILDQKLMVYICRGDPTEKLEWFKTINIAGKTLTPQEIRSVVYFGSFVLDARRWFVANGSMCQAILNEFGAYIKGSVERQEILEKVLWWHADAEGFTGNKDDMISEYLRKHRDDADASALWNYYTAVIRWAIMLFEDPAHNYASEQRKVEWGFLYNRYHTVSFGPNEIQSRLNALMSNPEIDKKDGIYEFLFDGDPKHLNPRKFKDSDRRAQYEAQQHRCAICGCEIKDIASAHADHKVPWSKGGRTEIGNLQILCVECNLTKSCKEMAEAKKEFCLPTK